MTTRRNFLKQASLATAGIMMAPSYAFDAAGKTIPNLGLQLYTLREVIGKDLKGVIAKVANSGYKEVETYGYSKENGFWGTAPKAFRQLLTDNGLTAPSGHYGFDDYLQGKEDILKVYLEAATEVGHQYLTIPYLGDSLRRSADDYKRIAEKLNKAGEVTKKSGLQLAYHNHDFEFRPQGGTNGYSILLKETNPSLLQFEIDLYWAVRAKQNVESMFEQNPGRFVMWHVKDMDKAKPELNTEVGSGSIDYKKIFAKAKLAGVKHYFVEQENFINIDPFVSIRKSADYVKKSLFS